MFSYNLPQSLLLFRIWDLFSEEGKKNQLVLNLFMDFCDQWESTQRGSVGPGSSQLMCLKENYHWCCFPFLSGQRAFWSCHPPPPTTTTREEPPQCYPQRTWTGEGIVAMWGREETIREVDCDESNIPTVFRCTANCESNQGREWGLLIHPTKHTINKNTGNTLCAPSLTNDFYVCGIFIKSPLTLPIPVVCRWKTASAHTLLIGCNHIISNSRDLLWLLYCFHNTCILCNALAKDYGVIFWNVPSRIFFFCSCYWFRTVAVHGQYFRSIRHIWACANYYFFPLWSWGSITALLALTALNTLSVEVDILICNRD